MKAWSFEGTADERKQSEVKYRMSKGQSTESHLKVSLNLTCRRSMCYGTMKCGPGIDSTEWIPGLFLGMTQDSFCE